jgi:pimeloyl-ACP methyl ester carboxylesterase
LYSELAQTARALNRAALELFSRATQDPLSTIALNQKSGVPAWKTIPSWAVVGTADRAIPPAELIAMAHAANARITLVPHAPHLSMVSNPGVVTSVIIKAARATS